MKQVVNLGGRKQSVIALEDGNLVTGTVQDCTPHLEYIKSLKAAGITGTSEMKFAAHIPDVVVEDYCNKRGLTFAEFMHDRSHIRHILNDPDYRNLRVWEGRV